MPPKNPTSSRFCFTLLRKRKNGVEPSPLQEAVGGGGRTIRRRGPGDVFTSTGKPPRPAPNPSRPLSVPLPAGPGAPPLATLARAGPHVSAAHAPNRLETSLLVHTKPPDPKVSDPSSPTCHSPKVHCSALVWQDPTQAGGGCRRQLGREARTEARDRGPDLARWARRRLRPHRAHRRGPDHHPGCACRGKAALPCTLWGSSSSASLDLAAQDR